jgi:hypothetical protein
MGVMVWKQPSVRDAARTLVHHRCNTTVIILALGLVSSSKNTRDSWDYSARTSVTDHFVTQT